MSEGAINEQVALIIQQFRWHRSKATAVKEVHEKRLKDVIAVMTKHDSRATFLTRDAVEIAAPQTRTQRAERAARWDFIHDDGIGVFIFNTMWHAHFLEEFRQNCRWKIRLALIQIAGNQFNRQQATPFQLIENGQ